MTVMRALVFALLCFSGIGHAGTLKNGNWTASGCGGMPETPIFDGSSIDAYNNSIAAINNWEQASIVYFTCLIKEANDDNKAISNAANREQLHHRQQLDAIKAAMDEARAQFNNR